ncbi:hizopuspepsin I [Syncephalastrum racemosum]|uniref:rhizopuspepsin n=1 Tax=Syncephalastrum racemosum TaxID=13706 RepID=A0A1X2H2Z7_SYNRA|nr:hizopuspepsin I [Syncephalastrum racemosum]
MSDYMYDIEYYGTVDIGTPPQSLRLDFDTGSADLWFASTQCKFCGAKQIKFDASKSSTFKPINRTFEITYGDKSKSSGTLGTDVVRFGDLTIENQIVELASEESKDFQSGTIDGLVGLAFGPLASVKGIKTPLENLLDKGVLAEPIFGVFLGKGSEGGGGEFIFGGYDKERFSGELHSVPVDKTKGYWAVNVDRASIGDQTVANNLEAIVDTGTTLVIFPPAIASTIATRYNATDNGDGTYTIPCDVSGFPSLQFTFKDKTFEVPTESLVYYNDKGKCMAAFSYSDLPFAILGDIFLKDNYVVFDFGKPEVRIAAIKK